MHNLGIFGQIYIVIFTNIKLKEKIFPIFYVAIKGLHIVLFDFLKVFFLSIHQQSFNLLLLITYSVFEMRDYLVFFSQTSLKFFYFTCQTTLFILHKNYLYLIMRVRTCYLGFNIDIKYTPTNLRIMNKFLLIVFCVLSLSKAIKVDTQNTLFLDQYNRYAVYHGVNVVFKT